jgi:hypothetical protein
LVVAAAAVEELLLHLWESSLTEVIRQQAVIGHDCLEWINGMIEPHATEASLMQRWKCAH